MSRWPRVAPVGDAAVTVEVGDAVDPALSARVRALDRSLADQPFAGFREAVPTYRALLVLYDPLAVSFADVRDDLLRRTGAPLAPSDAAARDVIVPARYGGDDGPDLADLARARGLSENAAVALHAGSCYTAFMLGFMPGFAYLGLVPPALETPRRATPRPRVRAGSIGIAGRQTGIYPTASPGGWNLIGRTSLRLFDAWRDPPSLILPGDRVRFVPVDVLPEQPETAPPPVGAALPPAVEVLDPGLLTTVQDGGRSGRRRLGVAAAGPMDVRSHRAANRALGNAPDAAALESAVAGPTLRFLAPIRFAVAGADLGAILERADLGAWPVPPRASVMARPGNVLTFAGRRSGCRAYVALGGGVAVPEVLGSRATDLGAGFGGVAGRALRGGDLLSVDSSRGTAREVDASQWVATDTPTVRVVLGPQDDHFGDAARQTFLSATYSVVATSDRVGCRLAGPPVAHRGPAEIVSDGMVPGSVQVPPDGQPIVMMADAPTAGGYPKIATVATADLPLLAQLLPGEGRVRFAAVTVDEAQRALRDAARGW